MMSMFLLIMFYKIKDRVRIVTDELSFGLTKIGQIKLKQAWLKKLKNLIESKSYEFIGISLKKLSIKSLINKIYYRIN